MTMSPAITWLPYVNLLSNMQTDSYYHLKLQLGLKPNQAARVVAHTRHQIKLPLVVEVEISRNNNCLTRLAQAVAAAGANALLLSATDFAAAKTVLSALNKAVTLPLFVRCPTAGSQEQEQLQALGATEILPPSTTELVLAATN